MVMPLLWSWNVKENFSCGPFDLIRGVSVVQYDTSLAYEHRDADNEDCVLAVVPVSERVEHEVDHTPGEWDA